LKADAATPPGMLTLPDEIGRLGANPGSKRNQSSRAHELKGSTDRFTAQTACRFEN
jgi:hypothetical protein